MAERKEISGTTIVLLLLVGAAALLWFSGTVPGAPGNQTGNQTASAGYIERTKIIERVVQTSTNVGSYPVLNVQLKVVDKFNTDTGISGVTVEVFEDDPTKSAEAIASDPMHRLVDSGTTDADGLVQLTSGWIMSGKSYVYLVSGSDIYAVAKKYTIPASSDTIDMYPIGTIEVYRVGSFKPLSSTTTITVNATGLSGVQYVEFDITIGEAEAGKVVKDPVMYFETDTSVPMDPYAIKSIQLTPTGTKNVLPDYIVNTDMKKYIDKAPIRLMGMSDDGHIYMTMTHSAEYTVTLQYDADRIVNGNKLYIKLDDLGDINARDIDGGLKAPTQVLTIEFVK